MIGHAASQDSASAYTPSRCTVLAYALAAAWCWAWARACGGSLPLTDNIAFLLEVQQVPLADVLRERFLAHQLFRPFQWGQLSCSCRCRTENTTHLPRIPRRADGVDGAVLHARAARSSAAALAALSIALMALFGLHTMTIGLIEGPLTAVLCCVIAVNLSMADRPSGWRTLASVLLLILRRLSVELGLLVWVVTWRPLLSESRGLSGVAVGVNTALVDSVLRPSLRAARVGGRGTGAPGDRRRLHDDGAGAGDRGRRRSSELPVRVQHWIRDARRSSFGAAGGHLGVRPPLYPRRGRSLAVDSPHHVGGDNGVSVVVRGDAGAIVDARVVHA